MIDLRQGNCLELMKDIPNAKYDEVLGVTLASSNQYGVRL